MKRHSTSNINTPVHTSADTTVRVYADTSKRKLVLFGQIPKDIMKQRGLSADAKLVFAAINMQSPGKENVAVSLRDLEKDLPYKKTKIGKLVAGLVKADVLRSRFVRGQVRIYAINHPNWAAVVKKETKCPGCGTPAFSMGPSGFCRNCTDGLRTRLAAGA